MLNQPLKPLRYPASGWLKPGNSKASLWKAEFRPLAEELGLKAGQLFGALRTAVTGRTATPPLFQTMAVLGKERCLERIDHALAKLSAP